MIKCNCGSIFDTKQEYRIHYYIGLPNHLQESRLTRITKEQVELRELQIARYEEEHKVIYDSNQGK